MRKTVLVAGLFMLTVAACSGTERSLRERAREVNRIALLDAVPDTVLGYATDFLIAQDRRIYLSDRVFNRVLALDPSSGGYQTIGRYGGGPGEFIYPDRMMMVGDTLMVWDRMNGRLTSFLSNGQFIRIARPVVPIPQVFPVVPTGDGGLMTPTWGIGSDYLLEVYTPGLDSVASIGSLEAPSVGNLTLGLTRAEARARQVPDYLKNRVIAVPSSDGGILVAHTGIPLFRKLRWNGSEIWRTEHDHPLFEAIRDTAYSNTLADTGPQVFSIRYWISAASDGVGGCYLLLWHSDRAVVFHLHADGRLGEPIEGPNGHWRIMRSHGDGLWLLNREQELVELNIEKLGES